LEAGRIQDVPAPPCPHRRIGDERTGWRPWGRIDVRGHRRYRHVVLSDAVRSDAAPAELLDAADVTVDAPGGATALLRTLL